MDWRYAVVIAIWRTKKESRQPYFSLHCKCGNVRLKLGERNTNTLVAQWRKELASVSQCQVEFAEIRRQQDLSSYHATIDGPAVALIAARFVKPV